MAVRCFWLGRKKHIQKMLHSFTVFFFLRILYAYGSCTLNAIFFLGTVDHLVDVHVVVFDGITLKYMQQINYVY